MDSRRISRANDSSPLSSQNSLTEATVPFTWRNMRHYSKEEPLVAVGIKSLSKKKEGCNIKSFILQKNMNVVPRRYCFALTNDIIRTSHHHHVQTFAIKHYYLHHITSHHIHLKMYHVEAHFQTKNLKGFFRFRSQNLGLGKDYDLPAPFSANFTAVVQTQSRMHLCIVQALLFFIKSCCKP